MPQKRPYINWYDATLDQPIQLQSDNPAFLEFTPVGTSNRRAITGADANVYNVGDVTVNPRGSKQIIWSSEGYTYNGVAIPALTTTQKANTHNSSVTSTVALDFSPYKTFLLVVVLSSFTSGTTPSFQIELDGLDDAATPNVVPYYKPTAATAATSYYVAAGSGLGTAPTLTGYTVAHIPTTLAPNGQVAWTVAGTPTGVGWTAFLYGNM